MERLDIKIVEESKKPLQMHPKKFGMWLFLGSVLMLFASLTSAYIVRRADGNWTAFDLPALFYMTTVVILLSSVTMQWAYFAAKKDNHSTVSLMLTLTFILGVLFLIGQFYGWKELVFDRVYLVGNPSGSFVYVLTGLHGAHIISALVYLLIVLVAARRLKVHSGTIATIEMCATYWHFLGGLWLYLFVFLLLTR
ncbi:MAG TPA: cytochrome c oxidase subunit 3 [Cyclobacteriaceae bacterium]|nr:cytochrome c oxidase subunit 3 [Cyclobacteriaceae bacterium]